MIAVSGAAKPAGWGRAQGAGDTIQVLADSLRAGDIKGAVYQWFDALDEAYRARQSSVTVKRRFIFRFRTLPASLWTR
ncbi:MAG TPA: hypothetical protein VK117_00540 [Pyrinomonadaceae bacterium]|nr:hypothetical protein [Pyrinomonadaceae bacterium]